MIRLKLQDDFDAKRIADSGQCFRWKETGEGRFRVIHGRNVLYLTDHGEGDLEFECGEEEYRKIWHDYLDLDEDYAAVRAMIDKDSDPFLYAASCNEKGIRILRQYPWEALISFIISQNRNIPAIKHSIELLSDMAGEELPDPAGGICHAFPTPQALAKLSDEDLTQCRLGYRCSYVKEAAVSVLEGKIDLDALAKDPDDERCLETLMSMKGVGMKVASCMLLYGLHHMDAFPVDVWVKRILEEHYPGGYDRERYRPYNGVFQQYMFAYYRSLHG